MASTRWRATQRDQRLRHHPHAWGEGHGEDGDTAGDHVLVQGCRVGNTRPVVLCQRVRWPGGQIVQAQEQTTGNDEADVPHVADGRRVAHGQFFA